MGDTRAHSEPEIDDWVGVGRRAADGYRLPTDAEWQVACRAGSSGARYGDLDNIAWYAGNSGGSIHRVRMKEPNAWGLFDMLGVNGQVAVPVGGHLKVPTVRVVVSWF